LQAIEATAIEQIGKGKSALEGRATSRGIAKYLTASRVYIARNSTDHHSTNQIQANSNEESTTIKQNRIAQLSSSTAS